MARKNLIGVSDSEIDEENVSPLVERPLAGRSARPKASVPVGGIAKSLGSMTEKIARAQQLEEQLTAGQAIVELDPELVEGSFVKDRLEIGSADLNELKVQIREHGQQVPVLVRPHPDKTNMYQIAYGHRRLAAARDLGVKVRAVVRELSDDQLVISQGQENNTRTNLSYIERALFAFQLEERGFSRSTVMASLGVDKGALSKMISVVRSLPIDLISKIGPAPQTGRRRWMELAELLTESSIEAILEQLPADNPEHLLSDDRFQTAFSVAKNWGKKVQEKQIPQRIANLPISVKKAKTGTSFSVNTKKAPGFDDFLANKLPSLFDEYSKQVGD